MKLRHREYGWGVFRTSHRNFNADCGHRVLAGERYFDSGDIDMKDISKTTLMCLACACDYADAPFPVAPGLWQRFKRWLT